MLRGRPRSQQTEGGSLALCYEIRRCTPGLLPWFYGVDMSRGLLGRVWPWSGSGALSELP